MGKLPNAGGHGANTYHHLQLQLGGQSLFDLGGQLVQTLALGLSGELLDHGHVGLADRENEVGLLVGEQGLNGVDHGGVGRLRLADQEDAPGDVAVEVKLLGTNVDIPQKNVIRDDVLHEGALVVLLLIALLGAVVGHRRHGAEGAGQIVLAADKAGVIKLGAPAAQSLESLALTGDHSVLGAVDNLYHAGPALSDQGGIVAGHNGTVGVNDTHGPVCAFLHLEHDALKNPVGHPVSLLTAYPIGGKLTSSIIAAFFVFFNRKKQIFCGY